MVIFFCCERWVGDELPLGKRVSKVVPSREGPRECAHARLCMSYKTRSELDQTRTREDEIEACTRGGDRFPDYRSREGFYSLLCLLEHGGLLGAVSTVHCGVGDGGGEIERKRRGGVRERGVEKEKDGRGRMLNVERENVDRPSHHRRVRRSRRAGSHLVANYSSCKLGPHLTVQPRTLLIAAGMHACIHAAGTCWVLRVARCCDACPLRRGMGEGRCAPRWVLRGRRCLRRAATVRPLA